MEKKEIRIDDWRDLGKPIDLPSGKNYEVVVKREPIPIIVLPGIMGSRLRAAKGSKDRLWDPDYAYKTWMGVKYGTVFTTAVDKQNKIVGGPKFVKSHVEVIEDDASYNKRFREYPGADKRGWGGLAWSFYGPALQGLSDYTWPGVVNACFELPVYAMGYDWRGSARVAGDMLKKRVAEIKAANEGCKQVILVTHSMGGLVARAACNNGLEGDVMAVLHTVQPATGAPAAYWRMKAGFERHGPIGHITAWVLGADGREVTAMLGHMPGGLQLLPSKDYKTNEGKPAWLTYTPLGDRPSHLPRQGDPYAEIYKDEKSPWRLILWKEFLTGKMDGKASEAEVAASWKDFSKWIDDAKDFHEWLKLYEHPQSWHFYGHGRPTADTIELTTTMERHPGGQPIIPGVPLRPLLDQRGGFGLFDWYTPPEDHHWVRPMVGMSQPHGDGDSTVPVSSGKALKEKPKRAIPLPGSGHDSCFSDNDLVAGQKAGPKGVEARIGLGEIITRLCVYKIKKEKRW
jgi:Lecithin:cholesterol acyltransferase